MQIDQARTEGSISSKAGERGVCGGRGRRDVCQLLDMHLHRLGIATCNGTGERCIAVAKGVVEAGTEQRSHQLRGVVHAGTSQQVQGLQHDGLQVVRSEGHGGVVERSRFFGNPHWLTTHLHDEGLRNCSDFEGRGDSEGAISQPGEIDARARKRHDGVDGERNSSRFRSGIQHTDAETSGRMRDELTRMNRSIGDKALDQARKDVVGYRQKNEIAGTGDIRCTVYDDAGKQCFGTKPRDIGYRDHPGDGVAGPAKGRPQYGTDSTRTDDTHGKPCCSGVHEASVDAGRRPPDRMGP